MYLDLKSYQDEFIYGSNQNTYKQTAIIINSNLQTVIYYYKTNNKFNINFYILYSFIRIAIL